MKNNQLLLVLIFLAVLSCSKTYKIPKEVFALNPYNKGERLIFESNKNKNDSIYIYEINHFTSVNDPLGIIADKEEHYSLTTKRSENASFSDPFFSIISTEEKGIMVKMELHTEDAWFYGKNNYSLNELNKLPLKTIRVKDKEYTDVWVFNATDREYENRDNFIEKLYWSKSNGIIRYDKKNNEVWELIARK